MKRSFIICFLILFSIDLEAQSIFPEDNFLPGWKMSGKMLHFSKQNLFDYINGGAEIFHEMGFDNLKVQSYQKGNNEITVECYQMESPESALGIYLQRRGKETPIEEIPARNSCNRYQFTLMKEKYFIQINNFTSDEQLIPVMVKLSNRLLNEIPKRSSSSLLGLLPKENLVNNSELLIRGPYSLQPVYTFGDGDIFQLNREVFGVLADYRSKENGFYTLIIIPYPNKKDAIDAFQNVTENLDPYLETIKTWENGLLFQDYKDKFGMIELHGNRIDIKINCDNRPDGIELGRK